MTKNLNLADALPSTGHFAHFIDITGEGLTIIYRTEDAG